MLISILYLSHQQRATGPPHHTEITMTRTTFAAKFPSHDAAAEYARLNGWNLQETEAMERGVWARFTA
jgi:hypothetical protein